MPREGQRRLDPSAAAYLAGFLDGDGSIHFQFVRQSEYRFGFYIRASMSLTQCTTARWGLEKLRELIGAGYIRDRGTGMSDLVITSRPVLIEVLRAVEPYVLFQEGTRARGFAALAADQASDDLRGILASCTASGRVFCPKPFEVEADYRSGCRAASAW
ncbi:MAG: LAGLIDADG family homing endonuclease [bacterium]